MPLYTMPKTVNDVNDMTNQELSYLWKDIDSDNINLQEIPDDIFSEICKQIILRDVENQLFTELFHNEENLMGKDLKEIGEINE